MDDTHDREGDGLRRFCRLFRMQVESCIEWRQRMAGQIVPSVLSFVMSAFHMVSGIWFVRQRWPLVRLCGSGMTPTLCVLLASTTLPKMNFDWILSVGEVAMTHVEIVPYADLRPRNATLAWEKQNKKICSIYKRSGIIDWGVATPRLFPTHQRRYPWPAQSQPYRPLSFSTSVSSSSWPVALPTAPPLSPPVLVAQACVPVAASSAS